jgi:hypothetical protein
MPTRVHIEKHKGSFHFERYQDAVAFGAWLIEGDATVEEGLGLGGATLLGALGIGINVYEKDRGSASGGGQPSQPTQPSQPLPPQSPNMTFFVTSYGPGNGGDLGGLAGADAHCQKLATSAGAGGKTWRAYLSSTPFGSVPVVNARDRIGRGPWQNFKGEVIAQNVDDLHGFGNKLSLDTALSERCTKIAAFGMTPNWHDAITHVARLQPGRPDRDRRKRPVLLLRAVTAADSFAAPAWNHAKRALPSNPIEGVSTPRGVGKWQAQWSVNYWRGCRLGRRNHHHDRRNHGPA